ncbi:unnamed protein product, partial [Didymodactylos carnosus]
KGLKDELKIQVKRQMRALTEQIPHAFLQIAKAEAELLSEVQLPSEHSRILFHPRYQQLHDLLPQSPFNRNRGMLRNEYAQLQPRPISPTTNSQSQKQTPVLEKSEQTVRNTTQEVFQTSMENSNTQQLGLRGQQSKGRIQSDHFTYNL